MQQVNNTSLKLAWLPGMLQAPQHSLTLVVKGCFSLENGQKAVPCDDPDAAAIMGDVYLQDDPKASLRYANDLVPYKPMADLTLSGVAYPQPGEAGCKVAFSVGAWQKSLAIFNERFWRWGSASKPEPFGAKIDSVPIIYENAFGGPQFGANPVGKGIDRVSDDTGEQAQPLPNIEHINQFVTSPGQKVQPAGFGPLKDNWADKTPLKGTYGSSWLKDHFPYFPGDFDWRYFNCAPQDQQVAYLSGDEKLYFEHLRPELPIFTSQLPEIRPRLFLNGQLDDKDFFQEVTLRLDTLHVDMEEQKLYLVWRGVVAVQSDEFEEVSHACLFTEEMKAEGHNRDFYYQQFVQQLEADASEHDLEPFEDEQGKDLPIVEPDAEQGLDDVVSDAQSDALDENFAKQFELMKQQMLKAGMPEELTDAVKVGMDPLAFLDRLVSIYNLDLNRGEDLLKRGQQNLAELMAAHGHDTPDIAFSSLIPAKPEAIDKAADVSKEEPEHLLETSKEADRYESGDMSGRDLSGADLSNRDFSEADFSAANLSGANLSGSKFCGADFSKAVMNQVNAQGADFSQSIMSNVEASDAIFAKVTATDCLFQQSKLVRCDFSGAHLKGADFTQSVLAGARFTETYFEGALFEQADLSLCQFEGVRGNGANFAQSNLRECFYLKSTLVEANFSQARLSLAEFEDSDLSQARLESVNARGAKLTDCTLLNTRGGENSDFSGATFVGGDGTGMMFDGSVLQESTFSNIKLQRADFSKANLTKASFQQCDMQTADLAKADLTDTNLVGANLFQAGFTKANLTRTDLGLSNLYGAEFYQARLDNANLKGANIKQTKIELGMVK